MDYFKKLPGFIRSPSGFEWVLLKKLPVIFLLSTAMPAMPMLQIYLNSNVIDAEQLKTIYICLGAIFTLWFFVGAAAIGCIVVIIMKGPAYVADPYELPKENKKLEEFPDNRL